MNLLGQDKDTDMEPIDEAASGGFVLNFEGDPADLIKTEESVRDLRGATRTLPAREDVLEAVKAAAEKAEKTAEKMEQDAEKTEKAAAEAVKPVVEADKPEAPKPEVPAAEAPKPVIPAANPIPAAVVPPAASAPEAAPAPEKQPEKAKEPDQPAAPKEEKLSSVSYASVAQAMVNAKKEPTGRFDRDAIDDETLLAELYALIGDSKPKKAAEPAVKEAAAPAPASAPAPARPAPAPRPVVRITPDALKDAPEEYVEIEEDTTGAPGWLKGIFILLISLLLSAMTLYAVASDVIGEIF